MRRKRNVWLSSLAVLLGASLMTTTLTFDPPPTQAADHRDATRTDAAVSGYLHSDK